MAHVTISCTIDACNRVHYRGGWCRRHHYRFLTYGDPLAGGPLRHTEHTQQCTLPGCEKPYIAQGLCGMHYQRRALHGDPLYAPLFAKDRACIVRGCVELQAAKGYCSKHYQRYAKPNDPAFSLRTPNYGGGTISYKGYRIVSKPGHPNASKHGKLPEHRLVMSEMLGRPLLKNEVVHHKNGIRLDNRPENLELWVKTQPPGQRVSDLVAWASAIIAQYGQVAEQLSLFDCRGYAKAPYATLS